MWLLAISSDAASDTHVLTFPKHSTKRVARKRSWWGLLPGHDHSRVQTTRQRHPDAFAALEIPTHCSREYITNFLVVCSGGKLFLIFPFQRPKIRPLRLQKAVSEHPTCGWG